MFICQIKIHTQYQHTHTHATKRKKGLQELKRSVSHVLECSLVLCARQLSSSSMETNCQ